MNQEVREVQTAEEVFLWALRRFCGKNPLHVASGNRGAPR